MDQFRDLEAKITAAGIPCAVNEPMRNHTSFKIGGPAALYCVPQNVQQVQQVRTLCEQAQVKYAFLGRGTNVLFEDEGYNGVIVHIGECLGDISVQGNIISAGAGAQLSKVCVEAANSGLTGLEFAFGIPGGVGGAVFMNAGAYNGEMKDVLRDVTFLDDRGREVTLSAQDLSLGYRTSAFAYMPWFIVSATFALQPGNVEDIRALMTRYAHSRAEKQPLDMPSAGSAFKRPEGAYASALIDQCGLRGYAVGGAAVSEKHCGFVVNTGSATCADVICLTDVVSKIVKEQTGFLLEREIRIIQ
jgi:UDP-N-acetylmuramate dehydrogenase